MIKHHLQYNSCDHLPETFVIFADLLAHLRSLTIDNVPLDTYGITLTETLAAWLFLFPYNVKRALESNMIPVEDRA